MGPHRQFQHELAVLALADLQEGPLVGGADVVALGIYEQDVGVLIADLAPEYEGRRTVGADLAKRPGDRSPPPAEPADVERGFEQVPDRGQALVVSRPPGRGHVVEDLWVVARLPADSITNTRSAAGGITCSLR